VRERYRDQGEGKEVKRELKNEGMTLKPR